MTTKEENVSAYLSNTEAWKEKAKSHGKKRALKEITHFERTGYLSPYARKEVAKYLRERIRERA